MGKNKQDAGIECPYYNDNEGRCITCDGGVEPGCKTVTKFRTSEKKKDFMGKYCRRYYSLCPLLQMNDSKLGFKRPDAKIEAE